MNIIPKPIQVDIKNSYLKVKTLIIYKAKEFSTDILKYFTNIKVSSTTKKDSANLIIEYCSKLSVSEYKIHVNDVIIIQSSSIQGVFYAIQTLLQMKLEQDKMITFNKATISDKPLYEYRGIMLDVSRHFIPIETIKETIDMMAYYKLNILHLHLTDDQGWRVEIKSYPLLTEKASIRNGTQITKSGQVNNNEYGRGLYYTKEQLKDIVSYAKDRFIDIIPEIDVPGHLLAAISVYPELSCYHKDVKVREKWGVEDIIACAGKNDIYKFLEDVFAEISEIFPYKYYHIGGDEVPKTEWKKCPKCQEKIKRLNLLDENALQGYFYYEVAEILAKYNKLPIIWDEKLGVDLPQNTILQWWRCELKKAQSIDWLEKGNKVIMSFGRNFYFDYPYAKTSLKKTYSFSTKDVMLNDKLSAGILGLEGTIWTEWISSKRKYEFNLYPRLQALAEKCWSKDTYDYNDFEKRLSEHLRFMDSKKINYCPLNKANPKGLLGFKQKIVTKSGKYNGDNEMNL